MFDVDYGNKSEVKIGERTLTVERIRFADIEQNDLVLHSWFDQDGNSKHWVSRATIRGQVEGWFNDEQSYHVGTNDDDWVEWHFPTSNGATVAYDWHDSEEGHALFRVLSGWK